jgi:hypothetical protein
MCVCREYAAIRLVLPGVPYWLPGYWLTGRATGLTELPGLPGYRATRLLASLLAYRVTNAPYNRHMHATSHRMHAKSHHASRMSTVRGQQKLATYICCTAGAHERGYGQWHRLLTSPTATTPSKRE